MTIREKLAVIKRLVEDVKLDAYQVEVDAELLPDVEGTGRMVELIADNLAALRRTLVLIQG